MRRYLACVALATCFVAPLFAAELTGVRDYKAMCDASAIADAGNAYILVACDEDNKLRLYARDEGGTPVSEFELDDFLQVTAKQNEVDMEGSARIGDIVYWIGSYGNNKDGEPRPNRRRFFATRLEASGAGVRVVPIGKPLKDGLLAAIASDSRLQDVHWNQLTQLAPEQPGAVNIEGLAATPEGTLWIAFRNPVPAGKALLVELTNPREVIEDAATPAIGRVARLDLDASGIRSIEYSPAQNAFLIASGPFDDDGEFRLWRWSGNVEDSPTPLAGGSLENCTPEGMTIFADRPGELFVLSDDGSRKVDGEPCKEAPKKKRSFRAGWWKLPVATP